MPTKTTSNKPKSKRSNLQKARSKTPVPKKSNTSKYIFIGLAALVVLGGLLWWLPKKGEVMDIQKSMETYLEDKYDKDFVVKEPKLTGAGLAVTGSWRAEAHPADDKTLVFEVGRVEEEERFFDNYTSYVWNREELPKVESFLSTIYKETKPKRVNLHVGINTGQEPGPISGTPPSIDTAIRDYNDRFYYQLGISLNVKSLNAEVKSDIHKQFTEILDFIKERGVKNPSFGIGVGVEDEGVTYSCSTSDISEAVPLEKMLDKCLSYPSKKGVN